MEGRHGFSKVTLCDVSASPSKIGAEVKDFRLETYVENGNVLARHTPRPVQLGLAASVLALHDAELDLDACDPDRLGIHVGTSIGNIGDMFDLRAKWTRTGSLPPRTAFHAFNHSAACVLSSFFNIRGPIHTTTSGCNSGIDALGQSLRMIQAGAVDAMLVVAANSSCSGDPGGPEHLRLPGHALQRSAGARVAALRPRPRRQRRGRRGGRAAPGGRATHPEARKARIYARLAGYQICSAGRNRQYSHDSPELDLRPSVRAFRSAMDEAGWKPEDVDLVNANGSSSVVYDKLEAMALAEVFGEAFPMLRVHSIKSMLGQHGAGSSALQALTACLSIRRGGVPPTINHDDPDPACGPIRVVTKGATLDPERVLVHAIGLGGFYYSVAAFEKPAGKSDPFATGLAKVVWSESERGAPRFRPAEDFEKPVVPWKPRMN